ncbi:MAG: phosphatidylserine decarboxylase family protein [Flavobacteriales bacterium]|nr:phosphatidylserine decarboxylase family protein [Flavobacteriales bacterium]
MIHKEGSKTLWNVGLLCGLAILVVLIYRPGNPETVGIVVTCSLAVFLFFLQFFRNPPRTVPQKNFRVLSPADGKIVFAGVTKETEVLKADVFKVSIFMSPFNVHVNRYPVSGEVVYVKHHPGRYLVALHPKSSELNERCTTAIRTDEGHLVVVRQIAGIVARRIVNYAVVGQRVTAGQEMGFIKFGSRTDVFWPTTWKTKIDLGDYVKGAESILA